MGNDEHPGEEPVVDQDSGGDEEDTGLSKPTQITGPRALVQRTEERNRALTARLDELEDTSQHEPYKALPPGRELDKGSTLIPRLFKFILRLFTRWERFVWIGIGLGFVLVVVVFLVTRFVVGPPDGTEDSQSAASNPTAQDYANDVGDWPPGLPFALNTIPAMIKNEIYGPGEQQGYLFVGTAGDTWTVTVEPLDDSALDPYFTLYGPSGAAVDTNDDRTEGDYTSEIIYLLLESGPYRVVVESSPTNPTAGAYLLSVWEG